MNMATSDDVLQQIIRAFTDGEFDETKMTTTMPQQWV